jgi:hypothetical protein
MPKSVIATSLEATAAARGADGVIATHGPAATAGDERAPSAVAGGGAAIAVVGGVRGGSGRGVSCFDGSVGGGLTFVAPARPFALAGGS